MRIVCWQTILMKYHTLLLSKIRKNVAKFVVCCSLDWRFKGYISFDLIGSGVSTTVWLRCSVGISLDWFCHVYKLSSLPAKQKKRVILTYMEKESMQNSKHVHFFA